MASKNEKPESRPGTEWARLLHPDSLSCFLIEELRMARLTPWGDQNIYSCDRCGWQVVRSGFWIFVPHEVSHDGVRSVVDHFRREHL